jgi:hypothetical protein
VLKVFPPISIVVAAPEYEPSSTKVPELDENEPLIDTSRSTDNVPEVDVNDAAPDTDIVPLTSIVESPPVNVPSL